MNSIEQIEKLILRFPAIAEDTGSVSGFWAYIEAYMEAIRANAELEGTLDEIEVRYEDLVEMANTAGLVKSDLD